MAPVKKILDYIEKHRGKSGLFWFFLITIKDFIWKNFKHIIYLMVIFKKKPYFDKSKFEYYYSVSFCITSMDRLCHIKKTLIRNITDNISYPNVEFVLLDYNSKDGLEDWVNLNCREYLRSGILKYYRTDKPIHFHIANAKNIAHGFSNGKILCNLDADNFTNIDFAFYLNYKFNENNKIILGNLPNNSFFNLDDSGGRIAILKEYFLKLNGYDEKFIGWGYEDLDFKKRAVDIGLKLKEIDSFFLRSVPHTNKMRDKNTAIDKKNSELVNKNRYLEKHR